MGACVCLITAWNLSLKITSLRYRPDLIWVKTRSENKRFRWRISLELIWKSLAGSSLALPLSGGATSTGNAVLTVKQERDNFYVGAFASRPLIIMIYWRYDNAGKAIRTSVRFNVIFDSSAQMLSPEKLIFRSSRGSTFDSPTFSFRSLKWWWKINRNARQTKTAGKFFIPLSANPRLPKINLTLTVDLLALCA